MILEATPLILRLPPLLRRAAVAELWPRFGSGFDKWRASWDSREIMRCRYLMKYVLQVLSLSFRAVCLVCKTKSAVQT